MNVVPLKGKFGYLSAMVDGSDYSLLVAYAWYGFQTPSGDVYAIAKINGKYLRMHRLLMGNEFPHIDHHNRNTLDNRRENLRPCGASQNGMNRPMQRNNKTGYKGVAFDGSKPHQPYLAQIGYKGRTRYIGRFKTAEAASVAYEQRAKELFGDFAYRP